MLSLCLYHQNINSYPDNATSTKATMTCPQLYRVNLSLLGRCDQHFRKTEGICEVSNNNPNKRTGNLYRCPAHVLYFQKYEKFYSYPSVALHALSLDLR